MFAQRIVQLRRLFLARLRDLQARRGAITTSLTAAVPSDVQHRQSTVAQLEVRIAAKIPMDTPEPANALYVSHHADPLSPVS